MKEHVLVATVLLDFFSFLLNAKRTGCAMAVEVILPVWQLPFETACQQLFQRRSHEPFDIQAALLQTPS